jgi:hypothetical protein
MSLFPDLSLLSTRDSDGASAVRFWLYFVKGDHVRSRLLPILTIIITTVAVLAPVAPASAATTAAEGFQIRAAHSSKCLGVQNSSLANSAKIVQLTCQPAAANQQFRLVKQTDGSYWVQSVLSGKCLNVQGGGTADSTAIIQFTCSSAANGRYFINDLADKPTVVMVALSSGKCLNVQGGSTADNAQLIQYTCIAGGSANASFYFPPTVSGTATPVSYLPRGEAPVALQISKRAEDPVRPLMFSWTDTDGRLYVGTYPDLKGIHPDAPANVVWTTPNTGGPPQAGIFADGRFRVVAHSLADGDFRSIDEGVPGSGTIAQAVDIGGGTAGKAALGPISPGRLGVYTVIGGQLWYAPDPEASSWGLPKGAWRSLGGVGLVGKPTVIPTATGARIFVLTASATMVTATLEGTTLSDWTNLGGGGLTGNPSAVAVAGNLAQVFVANTAGTIQSKRQNFDGTFPTDWTILATPGFGVKGSPSAAVEEVHGHIALAVRDLGFNLYATYLDATGGFGSWQKVGSTTSTVGFAQSDPTVFSWLDPYAGGVKGYGITYQGTGGVAYMSFNSPGSARAAKTQMPTGRGLLPKPTNARRIDLSPAGPR